MTTMFKSGQICQKAGKYREIGPKDSISPRGRTINLDKGDRFPPVSAPSNYWEGVEGAA